VAKPVFTPQANADFAESLDWYAKRDVETANRFEAALDLAILELCQNPERWPRFDAEHRQRTLKGFPFSIFYRAKDEHLIIVAIAHHSRQPGYWRTK
jgi:plasmid stabilization system protein ParE